MQVEALKRAVAQYETTAAELQAGSHQLTEVLHQVQAHTAELEAALTAQHQATSGLESMAEAAQAQARRQLTQLEELGGKLEEAMAARSALQAQLAVAAAEQARLLEAAAAEREAAAAEAQRQRAAAAETAARLLGRITELEGRKLVHLSLTVQSHEAEWRAEAARSAVLEAQVAELAANVAAYQQRDRLQAAW